MTRWVAVYSFARGASRLQLWREFVGRSGSYRQVTLKSGHLPDLPSTDWQGWLTLG